ncbi:unnamed protein product [Urochloa decumbens]
MKSRAARSTTGESRLAVRKGKAEKDPNKPKRPPSAFFVFMEEFRKDYKEKHPNVKQVSVIGKAGGEKWKSLSERRLPTCPRPRSSRLSTPRRWTPTTTSPKALQLLVTLTSPSPR